MAEILIADDERVIRDGMKALFVGEGFSVRTAKDGEDALAKFRERRPDVVILDVMMPRLNGFRVCEEIRRADEHVPIFFLTARDSDADQIRGLGIGADDYVAKDTADSVLLAKVQRAIERMSHVSVPQTASFFKIGRISVDLGLAKVFDGDAELARLTHTECEIFRILARADGCAVSGNSIVSQLRGVGFACEDGLVYTHVFNIRRKLGPAGSALICDRGAGYRLVR